MGVTPPPYPRTPRLFPAAGSSGDVVLDDAAARAWLEAEVVVEEKLDGANVSLWREGGQVLVATRGGPDSMDRAGQLGPLRAWAASRHDALLALLALDVVLYAEWLWLQHSVAYTRLPDHLVVLDLWSSEQGFLGVEERDRGAAAAGLVVPPLLFRGVLASRPRLLSLLATSRWADAPAEGVVLRRGQDRAKLVAGDFRQRADEDWAQRRRRNVLAAAPSAASA